MGFRNPAWPSCEIVEHADGQREFRVDDPKLRWIQIDHRSTIYLGDTALTIESPFSIRIGDDVHVLDPRERQHLGPLLALYPGTVDRLVMAPDGTLEATFGGGAVLTVPPDPRYEAWSVAGFWCVPGGFDPPDTERPHDGPAAKD